MPGRPTVICHGDLAVMLVIDIEWVVHCICMQTHCLHSSQRQFIKQFYKGKQISIDKPYHTYRYIYIESKSIETYQFDLITLITQGWH